MNTKTFVNIGVSNNTKQAEFSDGTYTVREIARINLEDADNQLGEHDNRIETFEYLSTLLHLIQDSLYMSSKDKSNDGPRGLANFVIYTALKQDNPNNINRKIIGNVHIHTHMVVDAAIKKRIYIYTYIHMYILPRATTCICPSDLFVGVGGRVF